MPVTLALPLLMATAIAIAVRPRQISPAAIAASAGLLVVLLGLSDPGDLLRAAAVFGPVFLFLAAMIVVAAVADAAGLFAYAAEQTRQLAGNDARRLLLGYYFLGALITMFLSLDVTAVMLAPIVCRSVQRLRLPAAPFVVAVAFAANVPSLVLPVSNLTNLLVAAVLGLRLPEFVRGLALPQMAAMVVNVAVLLWLYRKDLPATVVAEPTSLVPVGSDQWSAVSASPHPRGGSGGNCPLPTDFCPLVPVWPAGRRVSLAAAGLLAATLVGVLAASWLNWPLWWPAGLGGLALLLLAWRTRLYSPRRLARDLPASLVVFVFGLYALVVAVGRALPADMSLVSPPLGRDLTLVGAALATTFLANAVNNLPAALAASIYLEGLPAASQGLLAPAVLLGANLGSTLLPTGSLATMLVLGAASRYHLPVGPSDYLRASLCITPLILAAAIGALLATR